MIGIFIYGFGLLYLIDHALNYSVKPIELLLMAILSFLISITALKDKKSILISLLGLVGLSGLAVIGFFFAGNLSVIIKDVGQFFIAYYESFSGNPIDVIEQMALLVLVITIVYKLLMVYQGNSVAYNTFNLLAIAIIVIGFLNGFLGGKSDRNALIIYIIAAVVFYFHHYYLEWNKREEGRSFRPFIVISLIAAIGLVSMSQLLFVITPYPFRWEVKTQGNGDKGGDGSSNMNAYNIVVQNGGGINDSFKYQGRELMQIKADQTKYLKAIVYETYSENKWSQSDDIYQVMEIDDKDYITSYGRLEKVEVRYTDLKSPVIMISPYISDIEMEDDKISLNKNSMRDTYYIDNYYYIMQVEEIRYSFTAIDVDINSSPLAEELRVAPIAWPSLEGTPYEMPKGYEAIDSLAHKITLGIDSDYEKIETVIDYLKNNYTYNIEPSVAQKGDKIEYFLFESKEGFCQHFATSAVLMLRSLNIPSRYIQGYKVDPLTADDLSMALEGYQVVYDDDAHTWLEVYIPEHGWITFDATPGEGDITFETEKAFEGNESGENRGNNISDYRGVISGGVILLVLVGFVLIGLFVYKIIQDRRAYKENSNTYKVSVLYALILDYLELGDMSKASYESPMAFAYRIDQLGLIAYEGGFIGLMDIYEGIIYGDREATEENLQVFNHYLNQVKQDLKKEVGRLGLLRVNVKTFMKTKD